MSILNKITTGKRGRAQKVVIFAPEGFGKSTLASQFPSPLFFDIEDSTSQLDVLRLGRDVLTDLKTFEAGLVDVAKTAKLLPCSTLVVDTIDWLEQMVLDAVIAEANNPKIQGVEDFGYGKGYVALKERMTLVMARFDAVIAAGVTVVLLAHSKVVKFEPPDGAGPYDRYEMKLSKHVGPLVKEWADMLLFGNWRTQVRERDKDESGAQFKGVGGKERLMHCNRTAAWDAKNRHGMADVEKWEIEVIAKAFRDVGAAWGNNGAAPAPVVESKPAAAAKQPASDPKADEIPGIPNPETAVVDVELARICEPHAAAVTAYLLESKRIAVGEDWRNVSPDFAARIKKNPAGFLKVATNGKAVAA